MASRRDEKLPRIGTRPATQGTTSTSAQAPPLASTPLPTLPSILAPRQTAATETYRTPTGPIYQSIPSLMHSRTESGVLPGRAGATQLEPAHDMNHAPIKSSANPTSPHSTAPGTPRSTTPPRTDFPTQLTPTFQQLVLDMIAHPSFPLLFKKVFELSLGSEINIPSCASRLRNVDTDVRSLSNYASTHGIEDACAHSSSLDVFLASALTALENLKRGLPGLNLTPALQRTIAACGQLGANGYRDANASARNYPSIRPLSYGHGTAGDVRYVSHTAPGPRPKLTAEAREKLEQWFRDHYKHPYPTDAEKLELARVCGIELNQVNNFFGNKRMRLKRKAMNVSHTKSDGPSSAVGTSSKVDPSSVLAPQAKWRAVVLSKFPNAPGGQASSETKVPARNSVARDGCNKTDVPQRSKAHR